MSMQEIINQLTYFNEEFPKEQLKQAIENKEEIIPLLLDGLDYVDKNAEEIFESKDEYFLHIYAMYLLAQFKEKKAFPKIINILCKEEKVTDYIVGDTLTSELDAILFSTYDGNLEMLCNVIENTSLNEYARSAAVNMYIMLFDEGIIKKEELIKYFKYLINDKLINDESFVMTEIAINIEKQHVKELIDDVRKMYDRNCIEIMTIGSYDDFIDGIFSYENQKEMKKSIEDVISEMGWWACFKKNENEGVSDTKAFEKMSEFIEKQMRKDREAEKKLLPNKKEKPQRNDPCPCGSGKKYKKCCLSKDQEENVVKEITIEDKYDLLGRYPKLIDDSNKEHLKLKDFYDDEAIDIDKLVYKALKHRQIPMWVKRDYKEEDLGRIEYLLEAYELFLKKCEKENIKSFEEYDRKHMIHYKSENWLIKLEDLIIKYEKGYLNMIKETLSEFGN